MTNFALGIWIVTAMSGAYMWVFTADAHRPESNARATRLSPLSLFMHPLLALTGLTLWLVFKFTENEVYGWLAFITLLVVAGIGTSMALPTLFDRPREPVAVPQPATHVATPAEEEVAAEHRFVEHRIPKAMIHLHGLLAAVTMGAVLIATLQA